MIVLQDSINNIDKQNISKFYYQEHNLKWIDEDESEKDGEANLNNIDHITKATLEEMRKEDALNKAKINEVCNVDEIHKVKKAATDKFNSATYSTGRVAAGKNEILFFI